MVDRIQKAYENIAASEKIQFGNILAKPEDIVIIHPCPVEPLIGRIHTDNVLPELTELAVHAAVAASEIA